MPEIFRKNQPRSETGNRKRSEMKQLQPRINRTVMGNDTHTYNNVVSQYFNEPKNCQMQLNKNASTQKSKTSSMFILNSILKTFYRHNLKTRSHTQTNQIHILKQRV